MNDFERHLAKFAPCASHVDRGRLFYLAGRASAGGTPAARQGTIGRWAWPLATLAMALVATTLAAVHLMAPPARLIRQVVYVERPAAERSTSPPAESPNRPSAPAVAVAAEADRPGAAWPRRRPTSLWLPVGSPIASNYISRRWLVLIGGMDAIPETDMTDVDDWPPAKNLRQLMNEMLPLERSTPPLTTLRGSSAPSRHQNGGTS